MKCQIISGKTFTVKNWSERRFFEDTRDGCETRFQGKKVIFYTVLGKIKLRQILLDIETIAESIPQNNEPWIFSGV